MDHREPRRGQDRGERGIEKLTGKPLADGVLDRAWGNLRLTLDPIASSLQTSADHGVAVGTSKKTDLTGIYDLTLLNEVLKAQRPGTGGRRRAGSRRKVTTTATAAGGPGTDAPAAVAARLTDVTQHFGEASRPPVLEHIDLTVAAGRVRLPARRLRVRQVDAALAGRRASTSPSRARSRSRRPAGADVPGARALPVAHRGRERRARAAPARRAAARSARPRPSGCSPWSASTAPRPSACTSCPAACASASRWPAPSRRRATCCSWTSRSPRSTRSRATSCTRSSPASGPRPAAPVIFVTHNVREAVRLGQRVVLLSSRPGRVVREWRVDIPQPRRIEDPDVSALSAEITEHLREEIARHGH